MRKNTHIYLLCFIIKYQKQQQQQPPSSQQTVNSSIMQTSTNVKVNNNNGQPPARAILICHANSHPFQVCFKFHSTIVSHL